MTERFEVHESVTRVYLTGNQEPDPRRVAVPVKDVPGIVRAEVERALRAFRMAVEEGQREASPHGTPRMWWDGGGAWRTAYLAARFGAAQEPRLADLYGRFPHLTGGKGAVEFVREMRDRCEETCKGMVVHAEGCPYAVPTPSAPAGRVFIPHMGGGQYINEFTQADRDRLARMERFLTALARIHEVADPGDSRVTNVRVAAREYLR